MNFKRFLVFVCVCVCVVSLGLTTYYFLRDEERIFAESSTIYANVGDTFEVSYEHTNPRFGTEVNITIQDEHVVELDPVTGKYVAINGGKTILNITSNKKSFRGATIEVYVGDGSFTTPFFISTATDLANIGISTYKTLDKNYVLNADLSLGGLEWTPIGNGVASGFTGTFDFNFKTISNLSITTNYENTGLFAKIGQKGTIKNLILDNVNINSSSNNTGAIAGVCEGTIERSSITSASIINNQTVNANVGGLVGLLISQSDEQATIDRSCAICSVSGNVNVGGLIGLNNGGKLKNSFSSTNFQTIKNKIMSTSASANIGGLIGLNEYSSYENSKKTTVLNCYSTVEIDSNSTNKGALIGKNTDKNDDLELINYLFGLYFANETSNVSNGVSNVTNGYTNSRQVVNLTSADTFKTKTPFDSFITKDNVVTTWNFVDVWQRNVDVLQGYPTLNMNGASDDDGIHLIKMGNQIWNISDLNNLRSSNENWILMDNLDLSVLDNFTPIGTIDAPFNGTLDGNGFTISNLTTNETNQYVYNEVTKNNEYYGLFAVIGQKGLVYDLNLENINISVGQNVGALAGMNLGIIKDCNIIGDSEKISNLSSSYATGGLVGINTNTISNININYCNITGSTINNKNLLLGGVAGKNTSNGTIRNCKVKSSVMLQNETADIVLRAGGIVGENSNEISNCAFSGNINSVTSSKQLTVGGIAGANYDDGTRTAFTGANETVLSYRKGQNNEIKNCISAGSIIGYRAGGLVGFNLGDINECQSNSTIKGVEVGGLIGTMEEGTMLNCYANCNLQGVDAKSEKGGIVHFAYSYQFKFNQKATLASCIINCFSSSTFDDTGTSYRETATSLYAIDIEYTGIQATDGYWINNLNDSTVASNAKTAKRSFFTKKVEKELTTEECKGTVDTFKVFTEYGFSTEAWDFVVGEYPTLKNLPSY